MSDTAEAITEFKNLMADPAARAAFVELKAQRADGLRYVNIRRLVGSSIWLMEQGAFDQIMEVLTLRASGLRFDAEEIAERIGAARPERGPRATGGVAVLPINGPIMPKAGLMSEVSGGTSIEGFRGMLNEALADASVGQILLNVDSSGGMVDQIPEMAAELRAARGIKPLVAIADTKALSAAYWLASQADEFYVTPSGKVGSVGVIAEHEDLSAQQKMEGIKTTFITDGRYKAEGNPYEPLSDEFRAHMQAQLTYFGDLFRADIAAGRGVSVSDVASKFGEGRFFLANEALARGMVDGVATMDQVIGHMLSRSKTPRVTQMGAAATGVDRLLFQSREPRPGLSDEAAWMDFGAPKDHQIDLLGAFKAVSEPLPSSPEAFRAHMDAPAPAGHGEASPGESAEPVAFIADFHRDLHAGVGVGHSHPDLGAFVIAATDETPAEPAEPETAPDAPQEPETAPDEPETASGEPETAPDEAPEAPSEPEIAPEGAETASGESSDVDVFAARLRLTRLH